MEEYDYDKLIFTERMSESDQEAWKNYFREQFKQRSRLCVIYNPNCGCKVDHFVVLDRFPMSKKIMHNCPKCNKVCLLEISDPITFHCPIRKEDYSLEDLKKMKVTESDQKPFIEAYQNWG